MIGLINIIGIILLLTLLTYSFEGIYRITVKKSKTPDNYFYILLLFFAALWGTALLFFTNTLDYNVSLYSAKAIWIIAPFLPWTLLGFAVYFPEVDEEWSLTRYLLKFRGLSILGVITLALSIATIVSPSVIAEVYPSEKIMEYGPMYKYVGLFLGVNVTLAITVLRHKVRIAKGIDKTRLSYINGAFAITAVLALITNVAVPLIIGTSKYSGLGVIATSFAVFGLSYSYVQYRLRDIRNVLNIIYRIIIQFLLFEVLMVGGVWYVDDDFLSQLDTLTIPLIIVGVLLVVLSNLLSEVWDLKLVKTLYDPVDARDSFIVNTSRVLELRELMSAIDKEIVSIFNPIGAEFVVVQDVSKLNFLSSGKDKDIKEVIPTIIEAYRNEDRKDSFLILIDEFYGEIERHEREKSPFLESVKKIRPHGYKVLSIIPIERQDGIISLGIMLLAEKGTGEGYTYEDLRLLDSLQEFISSTLLGSFSHEEIQKFTETLQQKVDSATKDLKKKNEDLSRLREREKDMMDIMGHELRTPLTIIKMTLGLLRTKADKNDADFDKIEFDEYYQRMKDATDREVRLLETMLSSTKLDANRMELHLEKVDILPMIRDSILANTIKAKEKNLNVMFDDPEIPIEVFADRIRLSEVVDNLVGNAVKYTQEGSVTIKIDTDSSEEMVSVSVTDTGRGIPKEAIDRLGTKFFRVKQHLEKVHQDEGTTNIVRPGGTGLGLYVSFGLIKLMGGEIKVESELGKGSTFTFTIPVFHDQKEKNFLDGDRDAFKRLGLK